MPNLSVSPRIFAYLLVVWACMHFAPSASYSQTIPNRKSPSPPIEIQSEDVVDETRLPTGRMITPAGEILTFPGRPVDLVRMQNDRWLFVKDRDALRVVDVKTWEVVQTIKSPNGASPIGLTISDDAKVLFTDAKQGLNVFAATEPTNEAEPFQLETTIQLPENSFPCGVELSEDESMAFVCLSKLNSVAFIDLETGTVRSTINVGVAPFDIKRVADQLVVSNIGGRRAKAGDLTASSAGTETVVDKRGIASTGTINVIDIENGKVVQRVSVGLHPTTIEVGRDEKSVYVCNTNEDSVSKISLDDATANSFVVKPDERLPFGSMPSAIHGLLDQQKYAIALAGNNAVAIVKPHEDKLGVEIQGLIPTAWYPVAIDHDDKYLYVACTKGLGSRANKRDAEKGRNSHDALGTVQRIPLDQIQNVDWLKQQTEQVHKNSRIKQILATAETTESTNEVQPIPVPKRLGDPSVFKHVIYVIKENRTFDQVFGDIEEARGDPNLCVFPEKITPNHHALAKRFGILDNYYCNGVLSADGHSWATEGNVTPYLERSFGGFARSYTFGDDPITYSSTGFVWDHVLAAGLSFRNYGEMDYAAPPEGMAFKQIWEAYTKNEPIEFKQNIGIQRLRRYSCPDYPGWNMQIPDVLRMDRFLAEFRTFEKEGGLPNFSIVYLPQDHLGGAVSSNSHMADNDLAVGRLVDAVSHSKYWKDTLIVVNEDDPQNGYDHVDGHRSLCLIISAYSRSGVNHSFYNQTSALRTMLHVLGLPPLNQQDSSMPLMSDCFRNQRGSEPDLKPYDVITPEISLSQTPQPESRQSVAERRWREILATVPIERTGMKTEQDEDNLNRFVWHEVRGWETSYPDEWAGAHGKGLATRGLKHDENLQDENRQNENE